MALVTEAEVRRLLAETPFIQPYNVELVSLGNGEVVVSVPFQKKFERPGGVTCGPVFMAVADLAAWLALMTKIDYDEALMSVTSNLNTAFLNVAKTEFFCKGKVLKMGKRLIYCTAESYTADGRILTHHTVTYIRPNQKGE